MEVAQRPSPRVREMTVCDLCGRRAGTLTDRTVVNNGLVEFHFCESCFDEIRRSGLSTLEVMSRVAARLGKECPVCGRTAEDFARTFSFGCPECYENMRKVALSAVQAAQGAGARHIGKRPDGGER